MSLTKPEDNLPLLNVLGNGLKLDLISKNEVVQWSDSIISVEDEPDYFFIELSLAKDLNVLLSIMNNRIDLTLNENSCRVLLGVLAHRFRNELIDIQKVGFIIDKINQVDCLSSIEQESLWDLSYEFDSRFGLIDNNDTELKEIIIKALIHYQDFTIYNTKDWPAINSSIDEYWVNVDVQRLIDIEYQHNADQQRHRQINQRIKISLSVLVVAMLLFVCLNYTDFMHRTTVGKFKSDLYQVCLMLLCVFTPYLLFSWFSALKLKRRG